MKLEFKKSWLPNIIAVVIFAMVAIVYFYPTLEGYSLRQGDITSHKGMSKEIVDFRDTYGEEPLWTNSMFGGMPTYQTSTIYSTGYTYFSKALRTIFSNYSFYLFLAFTSFYILLRSLKTNTILSILGGLVYGLSTYNLIIIEAGHNSKMHTLAIVPLSIAFLLNIFDKKKNAFLYGSLFSLSFGYQLYCNHLQMTYYFGFIFASIVLYNIINSIRTGAKKELTKTLPILVLATVLALASNIASIYNTKSFAKHTMRGDAVIDIQTNNQKDDNNVTETGLKKDYITQWSYGIGETYNLLVPNAKGNSKHLTGEFFEYLKDSSPQDYNKAVQFYQQSRGQLFKGYWGDQPFTSGPNYIGAILIFLALLYIILVNDPLKWILVLPSLLALTLSWGKNFMWFTEFFIDYFPLYNKFRTVSSFLVVLNFTIPLMAILFMNKIVDNKTWREANLKKILQVGGSIAGVILILAFIPLGFDFTSERELSIMSGMNNSELDTLMSYLIDFRKSAFRTDSLKSFMFIVISLLLIIGFIKSKIKASWMILGIGALTVINLWIVDKLYMNNEKVKGKYISWEKKSPLNHSIRANQGDIDIFNLEKTNKITQEVNSKIKSFRKDHGRKMTAQDKESIMFATLGANTNFRTLNLDNPFNSSLSSYFHKSSGGYSPAKLRRYQDMIDFYIGKEISLAQSAPQNMKALNMLNTKFYLQSGKLAITNPYAFGNAWFINSVKPVESNNDEILEFKNIDPKKTAIIHNEFKNIISGSEYNSNGNTISLIDYKPNHLTYTANCQSKGLAVFSEIYYKDGWNAYIDGNEVEYARANYILRALEIPKGQHKVEFKFEPTTFNIGNIINVLAFCVMLALLGAAVFLKKK